MLFSEQWEASQQYTGGFKSQTYKNRTNFNNVAIIKGKPNENLLKILNEINNLLKLKILFFFNSCPHLDN